MSRRETRRTRDPAAAGPQGARHTAGTSGTSMARTLLELGWDRRSLQGNGDGPVCILTALCRTMGTRYEAADFEDEDARARLQALYESRLEGETTPPPGLTARQMIDAVIEHNDLGIAFADDALDWARRADRLISQRNELRTRGHRLVKASAGSGREPARWQLITGRNPVAEIAGARSGGKNAWYFRPREGTRDKGPFPTRREAVQAALEDTRTDAAGAAAYSHEPRKR